MQYDITIIGAGIVGLATAYKILEQNPDLKLLMLEKEPGVGMHQTGNNSGVIHSGIYYRPGSRDPKVSRTILLAAPTLEGRTTETKTKKKPAPTSERTISKSCLRK